jgi:HlyD family secretion protein
MKNFLFVLVAVGIAGAAAYYGYQRFGATEAGLRLVTAEVARGDVVQAIDATGRLEAVTTVQVGSQVSGTISALYADFNDQVRAGQVVARLEPSLFETQVEQARANLIRVEADVERARVQAEDAELKLNRARELAARNLVPSTDLENAEVTSRQAAASLRASEAQVVQAEAAINQAEVNLGHTVITAPIDGVVISRSVDVGQTVAASMSAPELFQIANDLTRMQVSANIDEADIGLVAAGRPVTFQVDAYPGENFSGVVSQVRLAPVIASNVVSYVTVIDVPNLDGRLRPGMTANVTVEIARAADTLMVPASALRFSPSDEVFAALGQPVPGSEPVAETAVAADETPAAVPAGEAAPAGDGAPAFGGGAPGGRGGVADLSEDERAALRDRLAAMSPEERQAAFGGRGGGRGGRGGAAARAAAAAVPGAPTPGQVWALVDGALQAVPVQVGISDGANVALVQGGGLQEGVVVATGAVETTIAAPAPAGGSPLLPQFGRRGGGPGGGGGRGGGD